MRPDRAWVRLPMPTGLRPWKPWPARSTTALLPTKLLELMGCEHLEQAADLATAFSRLPSEARDFESPSTLLTTDSGLITSPGDCYVDVL